MMCWVLFEWQSRATPNSMAISVTPWKTFTFHANERVTLHVSLLHLVLNWVLNCITNGRCFWALTGEKYTLWKSGFVFHHSIVWIMVSPWALLSSKSCQALCSFQMGFVYTAKPYSTMDAKLIPARQWKCFYELQILKADTITMAFAVWLLHLYSSLWPEIAQLFIEHSPVYTLHFLHGFHHHYLTPSKAPLKWQWPKRTYIYDKHQRKFCCLTNTMQKMHSFS